MEHFDYVFAGGGAAGLTLAYHMVNGGLQDKRILIIDPEEKKQNDRTWCFWANRPMLADPVVGHRWHHIWFHGPERSHRLSLDPYDYRMIRGIDFYRYVNKDLMERPDVSFLRDRVDRIEDGTEKEPARVFPEHGEAISADYVFDSTFIARDFRVDTGRYHFLKQHFAGWFIRTEEPVFDPEAATLFDLRIDQKGDFRFMYLLPESATESLVEYTLFSSRILPPDEYQSALSDYVRNYLGGVKYTILEQEEGIIPMTDQPFPRRGGRRIMNIGTRGGRVKASTGFAFLRTQLDSERIVHSLRTSGTPFHDRNPPRRYATFDSMLLSVLDRSGEGGRDVFVDLFERNPMTRLLRFLDEEGSLSENIRLMASVPWWPFIAAWFRVKWRQRPGRTAHFVDAFGNEKR
jgi:lycopene beta-cyclase